MEYVVRRITFGQKHHLFGFHDLVQTNVKGDLALSLEVDDISHPPLPGETCMSGIVPAMGGAFVPIHTTHTWNYPQGARQQWIDDEDLFSCNDRDDKGKFFAWVSSAKEGKPVDRFPFPVHCFDKINRISFWQNYDRLNMVGGYGYMPNLHISPDKTLLEDIPNTDGIWAGNVVTGEIELLVSICEVAKCGEKKPIRTGYPHYVTHCMLNPSNTRIAFLHRYRLADGGETTRLMTIGTDGSGLRCLAKGFLSHFTWISDNELFIWGAHQPKLFAMREGAWLRVPGASTFVGAAKKMIKYIRKGVLDSRAAHNYKDSPQPMSFMVINDFDECRIHKVAIGVLVEDGHPMACPRNRKILVNDTYPNELGYRTLMVYDLGKNERKDIGCFRMLDAHPDSTRFDVNLARSGVDGRVLKMLSSEQHMFTRSGFHCDLHPRWSCDGKTAFFDSIHEGSRQIYAVKVF